VSEVGERTLLVAGIVNPVSGEDIASVWETAVGYSKSNTSPMLKLFLSRLDELMGPNQKSPTSSP
jgi:hypothetical protein